MNFLMFELVMYLIGILLCVIFFLILGYFVFRKMAKFDFESEHSNFTDTTNNSFIVVKEYKNELIVKDPFIISLVIPDDIRVLLMETGKDFFVFDPKDKSILITNNVFKTFGNTENSAPLEQLENEGAKVIRFSFNSLEKASNCCKACEDFISQYKNKRDERIERMQAEVKQAVKDDFAPIQINKYN